MLERAEDPEVNAPLLVEEVIPDIARAAGIVDAEEGQVRGLIEKPDDPPSTQATTGCYVLSKDIFAAIRLLRPSDRGEYELTDAVGVLVCAGASVDAVHFGGKRCNLNGPEDLTWVEELLT